MLPTGKFARVSLSVLVHSDKALSSLMGFFFGNDRTFLWYRGVFPSLKINDDLLPLNIHLPAM